PRHVAVAGLGPEMERRRKALLYCLHLRSLRNDAVLCVTPKDDEKLAGQCHDHDLLDPATGFADPSRNQADKVLSACQRSHSQASSTIAARTRLLPSLPIPCSRSLPPLENGVPASPA